MDELADQLHTLYASLDNQVRDGNYDPVLVERRDAIHKAWRVVLELGSVKS